jgi:hypothetical protein
MCFNEIAGRNYTEESGSSNESLIQMFLAGKRFNEVAGRNGLLR